MATNTEFRRRWRQAPPTMGEWPMRVKPTLMRLPRPVWKRLVYPIWVRWYRSWSKLPLWRDGMYRLGDRVYWRGVRLICCREHFAGHMADHPWDPGAGWSEEKAATLWEPARHRDRLLLRLVGDKRRRVSTHHADSRNEDG